MTEENDDNNLDALVKSFFDQIGVSTDEIDETLQLAKETEETRTEFASTSLEDMELDSTVRLRERITLLEQKIQQKNELITKLELIVSKL
ncbi:MAG: hypothetical protein ACTSRW_13630, partial [Candidatus Helarchaeota archaeon]